MKRLFYFFAIAGATIAMACNSDVKKTENEENNEVTEAAEAAEAAAIEERVVDALERCDCGDCEQCAKAQQIKTEIIDVETLIAENGDNPLDKIIDKRSYAMGLNIGLGARLNFAEAGIDTDAIMKELTTFYLAGDIDDQEFLTNNGQYLQAFMYSKLMPFQQAKFQREAFEAGEVTEGMPELPEVFDEQFTKERVTRAIGYSFGSALVDVDNLNFGWFTKGYNDAIAVESADVAQKEELFNDHFAITYKDTMDAINTIMMEMQKKAQERYMNMIAKNLEESKAWLAEIEKEEGVEKTESGILYRIEREGNGEFPTADTDTVEVHYKGTTRLGEVFDSSYERDETIEFALNRVIKGWTEGMKLIDKGGKITLWIPAELAYGVHPPYGSTIAPNEALKFEVELFDITKAEEPEVEVEVEDAE